VFLGLIKDAALFQLQGSYRVQDVMIKNGQEVPMWGMATVAYLKTLSWNSLGDKGKSRRTSFRIVDNLIEI
jgi:hypothetical protein